MMAAEAGASANTLAAYRRDLQDFGRFLGWCRGGGRERGAGTGLYGRAGWGGIVGTDRGTAAFGAAAIFPVPAAGRRADR